MVHGIPAGITVLDTNSDGFSDRMYAGDMGAQVWRFDITNGNARASLVAGGVIASLGSHDETTHLAVNNRRFYNAPDVAAIQRPTGAAVPEHRDRLGLPRPPAQSDDPR